MSHVKLYVNILPSTDCDWDCIKIDKDKKILYIRHLFDFHSSSKVTEPPKFWNFRTDGVFLNWCQSEVYATVKDDIMDHIICGIDTVVMSFGQNYSGKTFVQSGFKNQFELRGLIPRFTSDLFRQIDAQKGDYLSTINLSVLEIYKNSFYDLFANPKTICKDSKTITKIEVTSEAHCFKHLFIAESHRKLVRNKTYNSHYATCIFTFSIQMTSLTSQESQEKLCKVHFIDLAGVETIERNELTSFKNQLNQGDANLTKTLLETFAIRCKTSTNVNYRSVNRRIHLLTNYLGKSFSTMSHKLLFCHIRPLHEDLVITMSLLKFGNVFKNIHTQISPKPSLQQTDEVLKIIQGLQMLRDKILPDDKCDTNASQIHISQERVNFVKRSVELFLKGELSESELLQMVNDCSLIINMIKAVKTKPDMADANEQTQWQDQEQRVSFKKHIDVENSFEKQKRRYSSVKSDNLPLPSSSLKKDLSKAKGKESTKKSGKKKESEIKVAVASEEVQVNLLEPSSELPMVDSRECHWAKFIISRPTIQHNLEKLICNITEKEANLYSLELNHTNIKDIINKQFIELSKIEIIELNSSLESNHAEQTEINSKKDALVNDLEKLEKELEKTKEKIMNAKIDWLDALHHLNNAKNTIEDEFNEFCKSNGFVILDIQQDTSNIKNENILIPEKPSFYSLQKIYSNLQTKYLSDAHLKYMYCS